MWFVLPIIQRFTSKNQQDLAYQLFNGWRKGLDPSKEFVLYSYYV
jgi:hypothetical protein